MDEAMRSQGNLPPKQDETGCAIAGHGFKIVHVTKDAREYVWVCRHCGAWVGNGDVVEFQRMRKREATRERSEA